MQTLPEAAFEVTSLSRTKLKIGSRWQHRNGNIYVIIDVALLEANLRPAVIYMETEHTALRWCRPAAEFLDGRFKRIE